MLRTTVKDGYQVDDENEKWRNADIILFQFPIYWFSAPAVLKRYFEDIYNGKQFYRGGTEYGRGGLLTSKSYLLQRHGTPRSKFLAISHHSLNGNLLTMYFQPFTIPMRSSDKENLAKPSLWRRLSPSCTYTIIC